MFVTQKKSVRVLIAVLLLVLAVVVAVKLFLPAEKIRDIALDQARTALGRDVAVGEVSVSLRGGLGVRLNDFVVANPDGFAGEPLLKTAAVDLKLALKPLFKREIRVNRLVIDQPVAHLVRRADGSDNFTFEKAAAEDAPTTPNEGASEAPPLSIASLTLKGGELVFSDEAAVAPALQAIRVAEVTLGLSLSDPAPGRFDAVGRLGAGSLTMVGPENVPELSGNVDFDLGWDMETSEAEIRRADLTVGEVPVSCTGKVAVLPEGAKGDLELALVEQPLSALLTFLPAELAAQLKDAPTDGIVGAEVAVTLTGEESVPVRLKGIVNAREIDLAVAQPFLPPDQQGRVGGRAKVDVGFSGDLGSEPVFDYAGRAEVSNVSFTESGLVDDLIDCDGLLSFTPDLFTMERCRAEFGAGTFDLTGSLRDPFPYFLPPELQADQAMKTPQLDFTLTTSRLDVDRWLPAASPSGPADDAGKAAPVPREIPADLEFPDLTCNGTFTADTLIYMQVPLTAIKGEVVVNDRKLNVQNVTGKAYNGEISGEVAIDLNNLQEPVYSGAYEAKNIEIDNFATRFAGFAGVVFGACNMSGSFATKGLDPDAIRNALTLDADAGIANGRVITSGSAYESLNRLASQAGQTLNHEQTLRDFATHISVKEGRVHLDALTTRLGSLGDMTMDGYYGFNGDVNYNGALTLTAAQTDALFSRGVLGELGKLLGSSRPQRLALPLSVGGTRTDPKVKVDLGGVTEDLQKSVVAEQGDDLKEEAKEKLGGLLDKWRK